MKHLRAIVLLAAILLASILTTAPASAKGRCILIPNASRTAVTVSRGPCYLRDFPTWCKDYVPSRIVQGQRIRCK